MKWCFHFFLFIFLSLHTATRALAKKAPEWSLHLNTKIESGIYPQEYGEDTNNDFSKIELIPDYEYKTPESWRFFIKPLFIASPSNKSLEEKNFFNLSEGFLRYQGEDFNVSGGNQIFAWGVTDGYNPLDILNSRQYFDPLHAVKLGTTSLVLNKTVDNWDLEFIFMPRREGAILPGTQSRWLPRKIFVPPSADNNVILILPPLLRYSYSPREELGGASDNNAAFRVLRHGDNTDFGLSFYEGVAPFPLVQPVVTGSILQVSPKTVIQVDPDVLLRTKNYRIRQSGLTVVSSLNNFLFKYATAYTQSLIKDPLIQAWTHENVLGLEKSGSFFEYGTVIGVLQYSFLNSERKNDSNLAFSEIFRSSWMVGAKMNWKEVWNYSFLLLYDQLRASHFIEVSFGRRLFDSWLLTFTANAIQGDRASPLGVYENNDSIALSLSRSF